MTTSDVSPYLLRPVRKLEEAIAEVEQQRPETPTPSAAADPTAGAATPETTPSTTAKPS